MHYVKKFLAVSIFVAAAFTASTRPSLAEDTPEWTWDDFKRMFGEVMNEGTKDITIKDKTKDDTKDKTNK